MHTKPTVLMDLDESLVRTKTLYFAHEKVPEGALLASAARGKQKWRGATRRRPSAQALLDRLVEHFRLCVFSSGHTAVQSAVLEVVGFAHYFEEVYRFDRWDELRAPAAWVLFDDLDTSCGGLEDKFRALGHNGRDLKCHFTQRVQDQQTGKWWEGERWHAVLDRHFVHCEPWLGGEDTHPVSGLYDEIVRKLQAQVPQG